MSFYTKFKDVETVVTAQTTANLAVATDAVLTFSSALNRPAQNTIGGISSQWSISTSSTTGTNLPNMGQIVLTSASSVAWILNDPTQKGMTISVFNTSSTSTNNVVLTNVATIVATDTQSGVSFQLQKTGAYFEAISLSSSQWLVTGRSAAGMTCT